MKRPWGLAIAAVLVAAPVGAQSDFYAFTGINFNFTNPGARARGIGGAFVAIADDSTASLANPAGLAYLPREASIEWISDGEEYPVGQLTQGGVSLTLDGPRYVYTAADDPFRVRVSSRSSRLNHASVVLPVKAYRVTASLFYGVLADLEGSARVGDGLVCVAPDGTVRLPGAGKDCTLDLTNPLGGDLPSLYFGQELSFRLEAEVMGGAVAYRLGDRWSVGLALGLVQVSHDSAAVVDRSGVGEEMQVESSRIDDHDVVASMGLLYRSDSWGFGLDYRSRARVGVVGRLLDEGGQPIPDRDVNGRFTVPERLAAGVALFPSDRWVVAAEVTRVPYSQVLEGMQPLNIPVREAGIRYRLSDATEYHLGAEYTTFTERGGWSLRAGWWRDKTHLPWVRESFTDPRNDPADFRRAQASAIRRRFGRDVNHFTLGFGVASSRLRLDGALDYSDEGGTDYLASVVFYF